MHVVKDKEVFPFEANEASNLVEETAEGPFQSVEYEGGINKVTAYGQMITH